MQTLNKTKQTKKTRTQTRRPYVHHTDSLSLLSPHVLRTIKADVLRLMNCSARAPRARPFPALANYYCKLMKVQCLAWVCAVLSSLSHIYTVPSVLMHANGLMLL